MIRETKAHHPRETDERNIKFLEEDYIARYSCHRGNDAKPILFPTFKRVSGFVFLQRSIFFFIAGQKIGFSKTASLFVSHREQRHKYKHLPPVMGRKSRACISAVIAGL